MEVNNKENWKKNILLFLASQAISLFGSSIVQYAIIWYITITTKSGLMTTIGTLCGMLPQVLISIFAGVWADRFNKKKIAMLSDSCIAIATLLIAISFLSGLDSIWILIVGLSIRSFGTGIQTPTVNALIPTLIPEDKLMKVNGINGTIQSIILIVSPAISGALMPIIPMGAMFFIDVVTAIIGVGVLSFVKVHYKQNREKGEKIDYYKDIKTGIRYIKDNDFLKSFFKFYAIICAFIAPIAMLSPLMVTRTYGDEVWKLTVNEMVFFLGNILGGGLITVWGGFRNKIKTIVFGFILCGILSASMGLVSNFVLYLTAMALCGVTMSLFNSPAIVILQEEVALEMQGRIFSIVQIISAGIMPLSMVVYGPLADNFRIENLFIFGGAAMILVSIMMIRNKNLKEYGRKVIEPKNVEIQ